MAVAFHESFWLATSAAAPVIALAAVVALPDLSASPRAVLVLRAEVALQRAYDEIKRRTKVSGDTSALSADLLKSVTDGPRNSLAEELGLSAEPPWDRLRTLARLHQWLSFGNVITQAGLGDVACGPGVCPGRGAGVGSDHFGGRWHLASGLDLRGWSLYSYPVEELGTWPEQRPTARRQLSKMKPYTLDLMAGF